MLAHANGIVQHYVLEGPDDAPVVTFSHSLATSIDLWEPQAQAFKSHYRVLRYDTRGHGRTEVAGGPYTFELLAADVYCLLQALGITRTHFVGLSNGGMVGQSLALAHPELLCSLVLCDTTSRPPPATLPIWSDRARVASEQGMAPLAESTIGRWFTADFKARNPMLVEQFRQSILNTPVEGYVACCAAIRAFDVTDRLAAIAIPTLIVVGDKDQGTLVSEHEDIHRHISKSQLVIFEDTAHLSNLGSDKFNDTLLEFLARHPC
jgi:3-oxoadipate enol-lactonase